MKKQPLLHIIVHELNKAGYNVVYNDDNYSFGYGFNPLLNTACYFQSNDDDDYLKDAYICPVIFTKRSYRAADEQDYYVNGHAGHHSRLDITDRSAEHVARLITNMTLTSYIDFVIPEGTSSPYYTSLLAHMDRLPKRATCTTNPNKQTGQYNTAELIKLNLLY